jgi:hypothetical protein
MAEKVKEAKEGARFARSQAWSIFGSTCINATMQIVASPLFLALIDFDAKQLENLWMLNLKTLFVCGLQYEKMAETVKTTQERVTIMLSQASLFSSNT